jgi:hypothetical protein
MTNSTLRKAARLIWNKKDKTWSIPCLMKILSPINKDEAIQIFKTLVASELMQHSFSIDDNIQKDWFRINFNKEKEWKHLVSRMRFFDQPLSVAINFLIKYRKPLTYGLLLPLIVLAINFFVFPLLENASQQKSQNNMKEHQGKQQLMTPKSHKKYDT